MVCSMFFHALLLENKTVVWLFQKGTVITNLLLVSISVVLVCGVLACADCVSIGNPIFPLAEVC